MATSGDARRDANHWVAAPLTGTRATAMVEHARESRRG